MTQTKTNSLVVNFGVVSVEDDSVFNPGVLKVGVLCIEELLMECFCKLKGKKPFTERQTY